MCAKNDRFVAVMIIIMVSFSVTKSMHGDEPFSPRMPSPSPVTLTGTSTGSEILQCEAYNDSRKQDVSEKEAIDELRNAIEEEDINRTRIVLDSHPDIINRVLNKYGEQGIHIAAQQGHIGIVKLLVARKADVNTKGVEYGKMPLCTAVTGADSRLDDEAKRIKIIKALRKGGAKLDEQDYLGSTALHYAVRYGHEEIVRTLIQMGADVNVAKVTGYTPLHAAASGARGSDREMIYVNIINMLINAGAKIESHAAEMMVTPLYAAVTSKSVKAVQALLEAGASIEDFYGTDYILDIARQEGPPEIVKILEEAIQSKKAKNTDENNSRDSRHSIDSHGSETESQKSSIKRSKKKGFLRRLCWK